MDYKFKKLSPMNFKRLHKSVKNFFIKIDHNWFSLEDIYEIVNTDQINPMTNKKLTNNEIQKILNHYNSINETEPETDNKLFMDYIELFESQINELYGKQEEIYALTQTHHHEIEKLNRK